MSDERTFAERIVDALADAKYIPENLATHPDRFAEVVQVVDEAVAVMLREQMANIDCEADREDEPRLRDGRPLNCS